MTGRTAFGTWTLTHDGAVLEHDGYRIALADIRDTDWWIDHLRGKDWSQQVLDDFWHATMELRVGWPDRPAEVEDEVCLVPNCDICGGPA